MAELSTKLMLAAVNEYWLHSPDIAFIKDINGAYVRYSRPFAEMSGHGDGEDLSGKTDFDIFEDKELAKRYREDDARLIAGGVSLENYVEPMPPKDGRPRYCITSKYILRDAKENPTGIFGISRDITNEYEARQYYESELRNLFELQQDALMAILFDITSWCVVDSKYRDGADQIVSRYLSMDDYIKNAVASVADDDEIREFYAGMSKAFFEEQYSTGKRSFDMEYLRRLPDGSERWVRSEFHFLLDPVTGNLSIMIILCDIDASKRQYSELVSAAAQDQMTGLLNRSMMVKQIEEYLAGEGLNRVHAMFMIDLDGFKQVNDCFGHQYGDRVLQDVAKAIRSVFRASDIIGRMGGDEFMVLMKNAGTEAAARRKAEDLLSALQFTARNKKKELDLTSSVGVTVFTGGERDFNSLYNEADEALYQSKGAGKNRYSMPERARSSDRRAAIPVGNVDTVHLKTLLEYMDGGVILSEVGDDIRITYVSPSLFKAFGRTAGEIGQSGERVFSVVHPEDLPELRAAVFEAARSDELTEHSYRVTVNSGVEWRHMRAKRLPSGEDEIARVVGVITDITFLKRAEEALRETEKRYRTAVEQTDAMLWEVDIATRTLTLTGSAWARLGEIGTVFPNAPEGYIRAMDRIEGESVAEFRRMFAELYRGNDSDNYYLKATDADGKDIWLKSHFKLLYDDGGVPLSALGVTVPMPSMDIEMRFFNEEVRFADRMKDSIRGSFRANLTRNLIEYAQTDGDQRSDMLAGKKFTGLLAFSAHRFVSDESLQAFSRFVSRDGLLALYQEGEMWSAMGYRRVEPDGGRRWHTLYARLARHPISGDIYAFLYNQDYAARRAIELAAGLPPLSVDAPLIYAQDDMGALSGRALSSAPKGSVAAVSVIELIGIERLKKESGHKAASALRNIFERLCRMAIAGDVLIGRLDDDRVAILRLDAGSAERQRERVAGTLVLLKELLSRANPGASVSLMGGFALGAADSVSYDMLLRKASIACRSASQTLGESAVAYDDSGANDPLAEIAGEGSLEERYRALELRYQQQANLLRLNEYDELTGALGRRAFYRRVRELLNADPEQKHVLVRMDINRFKVYNDVRGMAAGDRLLRDLAERLRTHGAPSMLAARLESDHFVLLAPDEPRAIERSLAGYTKWLAEYPADFRLSSSIGIYRIVDPAIDVSLMCDRALLALRSVKTGFETKLAFYSSALRTRLINEQQLVDELDAALETNQFELFFQPQVNYEDGTIVGAESLVRWNHPERGLLAPASFIPLFEKNGLITRLDEYVWERCCRQISEWSEKNERARGLSISVNVSRLDIYNPRLCSTLTRLTGKYGLPPSALKLEITESAYTENPKQLVDIVHQLHEAGFTVEMDDFGSGYSSLNTLKDVPVDILKLDMKFLSDCADSVRGGNILGSIIRMAHWLKLPVIAEGVETLEQADYLKSLGCIYMQGYHFARPVPAAQFEKMLEEWKLNKPSRYRGVDLEGAAAFWDPSAQATLLFNSFVGGAAILEYEDGRLSIVRANDRFYAELGTTRLDYLEKQMDTLARFDEKNAAEYVEMLEEAARTGDEAERDLESLPHFEGGPTFWTHSRVRPLAHNGNMWLYYLSVENITERMR